MNDRDLQKLELLREICSIIIDSQRPPHTLRPEVVELAIILADSQTAGISRHGDISACETRTSDGVALSPTMASMCVDDFVRTIEFIRGMHAAVVATRNRVPDRPVRILYLGCGPYATLAVPLMATFSATEAIFTLLDIHPESVASARSVIDSLGFADRVAGLETADAGTYRIDPAERPDIILMEIMRACLEAEPQVAVTRHLLPQAPNAVLIPEEVRVDLVLVNQSREFTLTTEEGDGGVAERDRILVGSAFVLNRGAVDRWKDNDSERLPGSTLRMPDAIEQRYQPMLFTEITVFDNHILQDYDSALTCPRVLLADEDIKSGDTFQFRYELGCQPRLTVKVCASSD